MTNEIKTWQERVEPSIYADFVKRGYGMVHAAMFAEIAELRAKVESLAADAERYKTARLKSEQFYFAYRNPDMRHAFSQVNGKEMDKVIDAMAKEKA